MDIPIFIDFEASGLNEVLSYPIEVGIALPDGTVCSWLIRQHDEWTYWSIEAEKEIHGISREQLQKEGLCLVDVALTLNGLLSRQYVYSDCVKKDAAWCRALYKAAGIDCKFIIYDASMLFDDYQQPQAIDAVIKMLDEHDSEHRAGADALFNQQLYRKYLSLKV